MYEYAYVAVEGHRGFGRVYFDDHQRIIDDYARRGYRLVDSIPTAIIGYGAISRIDLVFERKLPE